MRVTRCAWPLAVALATGFIGLLAFHGERPEPGFARFAPAGLLAGYPVRQVIAVEVRAGARHRSFRRIPGGGWRPETGDAAAPTDLESRIETGLKLLRNSPPQRTDLASERLAEFGLEPPRLIVMAQMASGDSITVEFGAANPLGLERYARIVGHPGVLLMPAFVAAAWEPVAAAR